jgi:hypothetical protein
LARLPPVGAYFFFHHRAQNELIRFCGVAKWKEKWDEDHTSPTFFFPRLGKLRHGSDRKVPRGCTVENITLLGILGDPMKKCAVCFALIALAGCAELVQGPRVVPIHEDRFYIRAAGLSSTGYVDEIAQSMCEDPSTRATMLSEDQFFPLDTRYVTFACVAQLSQPN